ncbi:MAG: hypothetical protein ABUS79_11055, partial [Pseudomonadota bacterium]
MPSTSPYDLVVFDVLHPWHPAGTAFLYTVEAFRIGKARLGPAGRVVVWLPLYQICAGRALLTPWSRPGLMTRMSEAYRARDPFDLVGTVLADRFRIEKEIAEGGFGVVYLATQVALDRPVAIKVLKTPPGLDEKARGQFR